MIGYDIKLPKKYGRFYLEFGGSNFNNHTLHISDVIDLDIDYYFVFLKVLNNELLKKLIIFFKLTFIKKKI